MTGLACLMISFSSKCASIRELYLSVTVDSASLVRVPESGHERCWEYFASQLYFMMKVGHDSRRSARKVVLGGVEVSIWLQSGLAIHNKHSLGSHYFILYAPRLGFCRYRTNYAPSKSIYS